MAVVDTDKAAGTMGKVRPQTRGHATRLVPRSLDIVWRLTIRPLRNSPIYSQSCQPQAPLQ